MNFLLFSLLMFAAASVLHAQNPTCADLKNGIFHIYPKNTSHYYVDVREGDYVRETAVKTGDTSLYKVKWLNDCTYQLQYLSGSEKINPEVADFLRKHKLVYIIETITNEYYTYKGYADKITNMPLLADTMWFSEKAVVTSNIWYKQVTSAGEARIKDTSHFAIVYVYREGKFTNSSSDVLVYLNDNVLCVAKNNTGYTFKVLQEGPVKFSSRLGKEKVEITVDVKFGKTYYVKSMVHRLIDRAKNYNLAIVAVEKEVGSIEFAELKNQL